MSTKVALYHLVLCFLMPFLCGLSLIVNLQYTNSQDFQTYRVDAVELFSLLNIIVLLFDEMKHEKKTDASFKFLLL